MMAAARTPAIIAAFLAAVAGLAAWAGFTSQQVLATSLFLMIICGTLFYWKFRLAFALVGLAVLLGSRLVDIPHLIEFAGLDIILFLFGMMTIIGFLEENHFFEYFVAKVVDRVGERPYLLMTVMMVLAAVSAALVDEVTSILFMMATTFHITKRYRLNPAPFLMMIVFATNIGSSATAVGNPIGVMIAMRAGFSFSDFLRWAAPISLACLVVVVALNLLLFRKDVERLKAAMVSDRDKKLHELQHVHYTKAGIRLCWALFGLTILGLVMHHSIEHALGLTKNTMLLGTALFFAAFSLFLKGDQAREFFVRRVDWWTLSFFLILFASVGTLKYVGVTEQVAKGMIHASGSGNATLLNLFTTAICVLTAFMDNVLAVATFIPVLSDIERIGVYVFPFWWAMLFGGTMFGNATIIGSTANIVAMGLYEKETGSPIKFMDWFKPGLVVSLAAILLAMALLYAQIHLMPGAPPTF